MTQPQCILTRADLRVNASLIEVDSQAEGNARVKCRLCLSPLADHPEPPPATTTPVSGAGDGTGGAQAAKVDLLAGDLSVWSKEDIMSALRSLRALSNDAYLRWKDKNAAKDSNLVDLVTTAVAHVQPVHALPLVAALVASFDCLTPLAQSSIKVANSSFAHDDDGESTLVTDILLSTLANTLESVGQSAFAVFVNEFAARHAKDDTQFYFRQGKEVKAKQWSFHYFRTLLSTAARVQREDAAPRFLDLFQALTSKTVLPPKPETFLDLRPLYTQAGFVEILALSAPAQYNPLKSHFWRLRGEQVLEYFDKHIEGGKSNLQLKKALLSSAVATPPGQGGRGRPRPGGQSSKRTRSDGENNEQLGQADHLKGKQATQVAQPLPEQPPPKIITRSRKRPQMLRL